MFSKDDRLLYFILMTFILGGCQHYDYGVKTEPLGSSGSQNENVSYTFRSRIYLNWQGQEVYVGELAHLSYFENTNELFDDVWRTSRMRFMIPESSGIQLIPESVLVQNFDQGGVFKPVRIESLLSNCSNSIGCGGTYTVRYEHRLPKKISQRLSFTLIVDGIETTVDRIFTLEYVPSASFWDPFMGI